MNSDTRYTFWYSQKQKETEDMNGGFGGMPLICTRTRTVNGIEYTECRQLSASKPNWPDARYVAMGTVNEIKMVTR